MARAATSQILELQELVPADEQSPPVKRKKKNKYEEMFALQLTAFPSLKVVEQLRFAKTIKRQWRFDFAFPKYRLAVELDGVVVRRIGNVMVTMGRHATVQGIRGDQEKGNAAVMYGWSVLHFLQGDVRPRHAINTTLRALAMRGWRAGK